MATSPEPVSSPSWGAASTLAVGLLAFVWVSDIQGVMFHRGEYEGLLDYLRPVLAYALGAMFVLWQWDRIIRIVLSLRFLVTGGAVAAAVTIASWPDAVAAAPRAMGPALAAGARDAQPQVVVDLDAPTRTAWVEPTAVPRPRSLVERMGYREREQPPGLQADIPTGWVTRPGTEMRLLNLGIAEAPGVECYVTSLPGTAGGVLDNVNRWRSEQMGLEPIDAAALAALPRVRLLGVDAVQVEFEGHFRGAGGGVIEDAKMLGVIAALPQVTVFLKMTGPKAIVDRERANFERVRDSLRRGGNAPPHDDAGPVPAPAKGWRWKVPDGWQESSPRAARVVTLAVSADLECYVTELPIGAAMFAGNINRWRSEFGLAPLDAAGVAALPKVAMLGTEGTLVEATGSFQGTGRSALDGAALLGAICVVEDRTVFVKMVGPAAAVEAARAGFMAFCASLARN